METNDTIKTGQATAIKQQELPHLIEKNAKNIGADSTPVCPVCAEKESRQYKLSTRDVKLMMIYMAVLMIGGIVVCLLIANEVIQSTELNKGLYGAMITSMLGALVYYSRKLYKACMSGKIDPVTKEEPHTLKRMGIMFYYFSRPLFAICFGLLTVLLMKAGVKVMTNEGGEALSPNFVHLVMAVAFFIGFSSGDFLDSLEDKGKDMIGKVLSSKSEKAQDK